MEPIVALAISLLALAVSTLLTIRQIRLASGSNHLPVVLNAFRESRLPGWFTAQEYILEKLTGEFSPSRGWRGLPEDIRSLININGIFYDDIGKLVAHGVIGEDFVIGSYGTTVVELWDKLAPYVYEERRSYTPNFWIYFEDLATRVAAKDPDTVYGKLRLGKRPPQQDIRETVPKQRREAPVPKSFPVPEA